MGSLRRSQDLFFAWRRGVPTNIVRGPVCVTDRRFASPRQPGANGQRYGLHDNMDRGARSPKVRVLVVGSSGVLGSTITSRFGDQLGWHVIGADVTDPRSVEVDDQLGLRDYVQLPKNGPMAEQASALYRGVKDFTRKENALLDAVVVASGGWAGDVVMGADTPPDSDDSVDPEEEYVRQSASACERMMRMNYQPVVSGGLVARRFVKANGLFVIIGASAALSPTPGMLGYGSSKAAAHHFLQSYGPGSMEEDGVASVGILPLMIDTPDNRRMLGGDAGDDRYSKMVKPVHIANEISDWIRQPHLRPHSGSLVKVIAKNNRQGRGGPAFHLVR